MPDKLECDWMRTNQVDLVGGRRIVMQMYLENRYEKAPDVQKALDVS